MKRLPWLAALLCLTACGRAPIPASPVLSMVPAPLGNLSPAPEPSEGPPASLQSVIFPRFTTTDGGTQGDPVNIMVAASESALRDTLSAMGWLPADPVNLKTAIRMAGTGLVSKLGDHDASYDTAPMSNLKLYGRHQDMAYEKNTVGISKRDHLRAWKAPILDRLGRPFWAIAATQDIGVKIVGAHTTHRIASDVDSERDLVVSDFLASGHVALHYILAAEPGGLSTTNGGGDPIHGDGNVVVLELSPGGP